MGPSRKPRQGAGKTRVCSLVGAVLALAGGGCGLGTIPIAVSGRGPSVSPKSVCSTWKGLKCAAGCGVGADECDESWGAQNWSAGLLVVMLPFPGYPPAFWGCGAEPTARTGLESWCQDLPREEVLHVQGWAVALLVRKLWGRLTCPERGKGKNRKDGSLSVAREEKVKDVCLAGSMHHLGGEWAGRGKVGLWFICPSPVG